MHIENPSEPSQYATDLTQVFPDVLRLARGLNQTDAVAEIIAFDPTILGFFNGFGRTMVRVASLRLKLDTEAQALVTYRAIATIMNRFGEMERFERAIHEPTTEQATIFSVTRNLVSGICVQYQR